MSDLIVADSFRVRVRAAQAEVRGWQRHIARFTASSIAATGGEPAGVNGFIADAARRIAEYGEGFPRLELRRDPAGSITPALTLRPLPELRDTIELRTAATITLENPQHKGPNIERLAELNRAIGAEALLVDDDGNTVEGATSSLLWWHGDMLQASSSSHRVSSVTEAILREIAASKGYAIDTANTPGTALHSHEVWAVNALHGIRVVRAIDDTPQAPPNALRLAQFRAELDKSWDPITTDRG